jgi:uncharacterized protein (TIGR02646 family)
VRGIRKLDPPTNVSPDDQEQCSMVAAEKQFLDALADAPDPPGYARARFDTMEKKKLRAALYREQRSICVYCERRIQDKEGVDPPPVEHWHALSRYPHLSHRWRNLYLSCTTAGTCDDAKKHRRLCWDEGDGEHADLPWPADRSYERCVGFTSDGYAYVREDAPLDDAHKRALALAIEDRADGAGKRTSILNLNHPALRTAREAEIDAERARMERDFPNRRATREQKEARAAALLDESPYPPSVSVRVAWLRKELGKHAPPREPAP